MRCLLNIESGRRAALSGPVEPHASKLSGPGAGAPSELTILRAVYFRTPNFLGQSRSLWTPPIHPSTPSLSAVCLQIHF